MSERLTTVALGNLAFIIEPIEGDLDMEEIAYATKFTGILVWFEVA